MAMNVLNRLGVVTISILGLLVACQNAVQESAADLVLTNAHVYTADSARSIAQSVAIRDKQIVYVGSDEESTPYIGPSTVVRDMGGAMLMPGLHDMHIHALGTVEPDTCDLNSRPYSFDAMVPVLKACIAEHNIAPGEWLIVLQWAFSAGNQPSQDLPHIRAALDAVSTEHPIFLYGDDGHHGAANSLALSLASNEAGETVEINARTLESDYAAFKPMINVDANGEPTGGINEDARTLLRSNWFEDMLGMNGDLDGTLSRVAPKMAANGITSLQDAIVTPATLAAYGRLEERSEMTFRLRAAMVEPPTERIADIDAHLETLKALREQYADYEFVAADGVKLFADAVLEGNPLTFPPTLPVAALLENYKQPIFAGSVDDGSFDVVGYVDQDREVCQSVKANPQSYTTSERLEAFVTEYGFYPQQCLPNSGVLEHEEAFVRAYIRKATEAGFHVHVHALADKGVRIAVDEFSKVKAIADRNGTSQSLAHVQLAHPDDQKRIGELGISVVFTFVWATPGIAYDMMVTPFIEEVRGIADLYNPDTYYMQNVYPVKRIQDYGGNIVNGSDAPVGGRDPIPFVSMQQAITRSNGETIMNADQRIDVHSAIAAFTINAAKLFGHSDMLGSIEAGKTADLIALDRNIVELAEAGMPQEIGGTQVTLTIFNGKIVHDAATN
ncbi:amidohydrolase [Woeseia oceani]|nr:amidohydrolase family protein [Woeseia oceani]